MSQSLSRVVRIDKPLDGQRVCRNCIAKSRIEECVRCGARREPGTRDAERLKASELQRSCAELPFLLGPRYPAVCGHPRLLLRRHRSDPDASRARVVALLLGPERPDM